MDILTPQPNTELDTTASDALALAGQAANRAAADHFLDDYRMIKAAQTLRRHSADLARFARFLRQVGRQTQRRDSHLGAGLITGADRLARFAADLPDVQKRLDLGAWRGVTWGLVAKFKEWLLEKGFAVRTINHSISTVRIYAEKSVQAGVLDDRDLVMIRTIGGYKSSEGKQVDEKRERTRRGCKKAQPILLKIEQAQRLKTERPDTPRGRRDALLMCLLLDHGLRAGEVEALAVASIDLGVEELHIYRPKTDTTGTHKLTRDTLKAASRYYEQDAMAIGSLMRGSRKGRAGRLTEAGMSTRAITARVRTLGEVIGVVGLSAHDCRHYAATYLAKVKRKGVNELMDIFGWTSAAMAVNYVESARVVELE